MPHILPLAATAAATAAPAAAAASGAAATASLSATLVSVASQAAVSMAVSAAMSVLSPKVGQAGRPVDWTLNPDAPIPFAFGRVGVAGTVIHKRTFGPDKMYYGFVSVLSGAGPIDGFESFTADDFPVTFNAQGKATTSEWRDEMFRATRLGTQPDSWLPTPTGLKNNATLPSWSASHRASGKALSLLLLAENSKRTAFPNGEVKPIEVIRGLKCWDPRLDSTYPGGSGSCRLDNPATWVWSQNPAICAIKWILGLWEDGTGRGTPQVGQQVGGIGVKLSGIDLPAYVAAANVCDANGWTCAAYPNTDDDKHQVLVSFLQAAGAIYSQRGGKISLIQRASPRASVATITADDVIGAIEVDTAASRIDRINTIQPSFWSAAHRWQITALDEVTAQAYRIADGGKRSRGITYHYVTNANQAAQLAALQIAHARESMAGQVALKPQHQRLQPGDAFTISEPGFMLDGVKCLVMNTEYDPAEAVVRVTFVSETDAKYPFALGQSTVPPVPPVLTANDNEVSPPLPDDWVVVVRPTPPGGGGGVPGFDLTGLVSNATAARVLVEYGLASDGPWTQAYNGPPTTERVEIYVQPKTTYWIAISYFNAAGVQSSRTIYGPFTSGALVADEIDQEAFDEIRNEFDDLIGPLRDDLNDQIQATLDNAAAAMAAIAQEARDRIAAIEAERLARGQAIAEVQTDVNAVKDDLSAEVTARTSAISAVEQSISVVDQEVRTYADDKIAEATLNFTTTAAFEGALASTLNSAKSYTDTLRSDASQTYATTSALSNGLSGTLSSAQSYTDALRTYATQTFVTSSTLGTANANTLQAAKTYADQTYSSATLNFATKTERANGDASTLTGAKSYTDDLRTYATQTFATQTTMSGVSSAATLALSTAQTADGKASALIGLETQVGGLITGIYSGNNGRIGSVRISAHHFSVETPGTPGDRLEFNGTAGLRIFKNGVKRIHLGFI